jgi:hypothetical protein
MNLRQVVYLSALPFAAAVAGTSAFAETRIGEAAVVKNEVVRVAASSNSPINVGDEVLRDEVVHTGLDSATRLVLADSTNLSLGPNSTITLDRTVFDDEHRYRDLAIRLANGAFRFVTGHSEKPAYKITTSVATIGVRGTVLDILAQRGRTIVVLQEGASSVCTLSFQCVQLTQPGETAIITAVGNGGTTIKKTGSSPWNFAATCAAATGLCTVTDYADATQPSTPPAVPPVDEALCGR